MPTAQPTRPISIVSPTWLLTTIGLVVLAAVGCSWLTLCLLYWQGSWQLLYHPRPTINRTPASIGIAYEPVRFATTETGKTLLTGWWLPDPSAEHTILYLHSAKGNLSDTIDTLYLLHKQHLAIFAIDYRGYGQSEPAHPNEKQFRQDAEWALTWLTLTHNIPAKNIVVYGSGLGANLAAELAADHSELAGVILDEPQQHPLDPAFNSPRSKLVPAHWLVSDRYGLSNAAQSLKIPSLWLLAEPGKNQSEDASDAYKAAYQTVSTPKESAWLRSPVTSDHNYGATIQGWLDDLK